MIATIQPSVLSGEVSAPPSKSSMQRACAAAALSPRNTLIKNAGKSNDDLAAIGVIKALGATVGHIDENTLSITGPEDLSKSHENITINCGESGLGLRMFAPIAALRNGEVNITGSGSLTKRPMNFFDEIFPQLNIAVTSNNGKLPIHIKGPLYPANITIDGSLSSQFLTGLMMAFAKACTGPVSISVNNLKSIPYINLTLSVLKHFGWAVTHDAHKTFYFQKQNPLHAVKYTVEGDWSGAAFLLVAGAVSGKVYIKGIDADSTQADKAIVSALEKAGANMRISKTGIEISAEKLNAFEFDATDCPDLFPPLVSLAAYCEGTTTIKGTGRLAYKESNRSLTLQSEFQKLGINISLKDDEMYIEGRRILTGATVHSNHDHRIAMACAVAALRADGPVIIHDAEAVNKSYPAFFTDMQMLNTILQMS